ncbi:HD domain-containing protein [Alkaliphilus sp. B6464]|uniref:HD domain-containing protein n=1 Tax=Alkaliphilus sp. B6464 TaxID=2731219 RepID=UPI001BA49954|nr:HD domain-containing protein [Alkaliphilus sp. B6464]QUH21733.1 HD domain-containing protein [Alkaliphilus sp. B6464]
MNFKDRINKWEKWISDTYSKRDYEGILFRVDSKIRLQTYMDLFDEIPDKIKYVLFIEVYTRMDFGFHYIKPEFFQRILKYKPQSNNDKVAIELSSIDNKGFITVYRGEGSKSTPFDKAYSWTDDFNVALKFSSNWGNFDGKIYEAKIHTDHIIDFINKRNEREVLLFPDKLHKVKELDLYNLESMMVRLEDDGYLPWYLYFERKIKPDYFKEAYGIHGITHAKRVLFHSLCLGCLMELNNEDIMILGQTSIYHDIGRINDEKCNHHGKLSWLKINELRIAPAQELCNVDMEIVKFIIENHNLDDEIALKNIDKYSISKSEKPRAIKLYNIFCDCDSLDRVRINSFDVKYLRNSESKKLIMLAKEILSIIN